MGPLTLNEHPTYLFSIDLEDVRKETDDGDRYPDRVPLMTKKLLAFLAEHRVRTTFFAVGEIAEQHPQVIRDIVAAGHEIGCHTHRHGALDELGPEGFKTDLQDNLAALRAAGAEEVVGFRAPFFSLVEETRWAYDVLAELGFLYSSSVLSARSPVYGWDGFGQDFRQVNGVWELPLTLAETPVLRVPFGGGIYFRVLPGWLTARGFRNRHKQQRPVVGYLHLQDFDGEQQRFRYANYNFVYNRLLYYNRRHCFAKLAKVIDSGCRIVPYREFVRAEC